MLRLRKKSFPLPVTLVKERCRYRCCHTKNGHHRLRYRYHASIIKKMNIISRRLGGFSMSKRQNLVSRMILSVRIAILPGELESLRCQYLAKLATKVLMAMVVLLVFAQKRIEMATPCKITQTILHNLFGPGAKCGRIDGERNQESDWVLSWDERTRIIGRKKASYSTKNKHLVSGCRKSF